MWQLICFTVCSRPNPPPPKGEENARSTSHGDPPKALIFSRLLCLKILFLGSAPLNIEVAILYTHIHILPPPSIITKLFDSSPGGELTIYINLQNPPFFSHTVYMQNGFTCVCGCKVIQSCFPRNDQSFWTMVLKREFMWSLLFAYLVCIYAVH